MFTHFCFNSFSIIIIFLLLLLQFPLCFSSSSSFFFHSLFLPSCHQHYYHISEIYIICFCFLFFFSSSVFFVCASSPLRNFEKKKINAANMTLKGGTSQACAACKYQRRKCSSECPLAPYFPPDQPKMFQNAHKLFGVSNILKIIKDLDTPQKAEAMRSIIYQANIRDRFPVHGCWGIICQLHYQIRQAEEELHATHAQLEMYRQHHQHQISSLADDVASQLELGMAPPTNALPLFTHNTPQPYNSVNALPVSQQHSYSNSSNITYSSGYLDSKDHLGNSMWVQHAYGTTATTNSTNNNNNNAMALQSQLVASQALAVQQEIVQDYDEIHPFFDTIEDRQYNSSSDDSLKDTTESIEHVAENELKNAAARFTLTSVN